MEMKKINHEKTNAPKKEPNMMHTTPNGKRKFFKSSQRKAKLITSFRKIPHTLGELTSHWKKYSHRRTGIGSTRFSFPIDIRFKALRSLDRCVHDFNQKIWEKPSDKLLGLFELRKKLIAHKETSVQRHKAVNALLEKITQDIQQTIHTMKQNTDDENGAYEQLFADLIINTADIVETQKGVNELTPLLDIVKITAPELDLKMINELTTQLIHRFVDDWFTEDNFLLLCKQSSNIMSTYLKRMISASPSLFDPVFKENPQLLDKKPLTESDISDLKSNSVQMDQLIKKILSSTPLLIKVFQSFEQDTGFMCLISKFFFHHQLSTFNNPQVSHLIHFLHALEIQQNNRIMQLSTIIKKQKSIHAPISQDVLTDAKKEKDIIESTSFFDILNHVTINFLNEVAFYYTKDKPINADSKLHKLVESFNLPTELAVLLENTLKSFHQPIAPQPNAAAAA